MSSNAVFGKNLENVRKRVNIKLYNRWEGRYGAKVNIAKPNFKKIIVFNDNLVAIEQYKHEIKITRPVIVGICILEQSKLFMYNFHYNIMLSNYDYQDCRIAYTDTDSFIYYLKGEDPYKMIKENSNLFDTSGYSPDNVHKISQRNKQVCGLMKNENKGMIMTEFVGLRAKMYSYMVDHPINNEIVEKRAEGVKSCILKNKITFDDYKNCLFNMKTECSIRLMTRELSVTITYTPLLGIISKLKSKK